MSKAIFPGSFDPVTNGHLDLIRRACTVFDQLIVVVGNNLSKHYLFSQTQRVKLLKANVRDMKRVKVIAENGLTVDLMKRLHVRIIVRGIRNSRDLDFEKSVALDNHHLDPKIETVFLLANPKYEWLSSQIIKETFHFGGKILDCVPNNVARKMIEIRKRGSK